MAPFLPYHPPRSAFVATHSAAPSTGRCAVNINGRMVLPALLLCLWVYWAYGAFSKGDTSTGLGYLAIGAALATWRFRRAMA